MIYFVPFMMLLMLATILRWHFYTNSDLIKYTAARKIFVLAISLEFFALIASLIINSLL